MRLTSIVALSMALAFPPALGAQQVEGELDLACQVDASGVVLTIRGGASRGNVALLVSLDGKGTTRLPESAGGGKISLGAPIWVLSFAEAEASGCYELRIPLDTQALADQELTVFVQGIGISFEQESGGAVGIRISNRLEVDFAREAEDEQGGAEPSRVDPRGEGR